MAWLLRTMEAHPRTWKKRCHEWGGRSCWKKTIQQGSTPENLAFLVVMATYHRSRAGGSPQAKTLEQEAWKQLEAESFRARNQRYADIDAELDPLQQAKLRIFEFEVERRIRDLMRRVRGQQQPRQRQDFRPRDPGTPSSQL